MQASALTTANAAVAINRCMTARHALTLGMQEARRTRGTDSAACFIASLKKTQLALIHKVHRKLTTNQCSRGRTASVYEDRGEIMKTKPPCYVRSAYNLTQLGQNG